MEECLYEPIAHKNVIIIKGDDYYTTEERSEKTTWKLLLRQIIICTSIWNTFFIIGLCLGAPTITLAQLRREANYTETVSEEMASWISSVHGLAAIPWFTLAIASHKFGRKYPCFVVNIVTLISYIVLYLSNTPKYILISEILQSAGFACISVVCMSAIIELTTAKYRGVFLTLLSASATWGMWIANALGTFFHWKSIAIAGIVCSLYNLLIILYWCESPSWLASKYRYEECARLHKWIKGEDVESTKELAGIIRSCKEFEENQNKEKIKGTNILILAYRTLLEKQFYMPISLSIAVISLAHSSGKVVCSVYAIDLLKNIISTESTVYIGMLLLDGVAVVGMYIGCGLAKYAKRRTLLLASTLVAIFFLFMLALYLYLTKLKVINENHYISIGILACFYLFISFGPMILSTTIYGEIIPLRYRTACMFISGIFGNLLLNITLKTALQMFRILELHGAFLFYGIMTLLIMIYIYKFLPETKDKTLEEIEDFFVDKKVETKVLNELLFY